MHSLSSGMANSDASVAGIKVGNIFSQVIGNSTHKLNSFYPRLVLCDSNSNIIS